MLGKRFNEIIEVYTHINYLSVVLSTSVFMFEKSISEQLFLQFGLKKWTMDGQSCIEKNVLVPFVLKAAVLLPDSGYQPPLMRIVKESFNSAKKMIYKLT